MNVPKIIHHIIRDISPCLDTSREVREEPPFVCLNDSRLPSRWTNAGNYNSGINQHVRSTFEPARFPTSSNNYLNQLPNPGASFLPFEASRCEQLRERVQTRKHVKLSTRGGEEKGELVTLFVEVCPTRRRGRARMDPFSWKIHETLEQNPRDVSYRLTSGQASLWRGKKKSAEWKNFPETSTGEELCPAAWLAHRRCRWNWIWSGWIFVVERTGRDVREATRAAAIHPACSLKGNF